MSSTTVSFQGLTTGLQTDSLVAAIIAQEGKSVQAWKDRQTRNQATTTALQSIRTGMNALSISLAAIQDKINLRTVTSSDSNNAYVTATASGAVLGNYDLSVDTVATKARISSTLVGGVPQDFAVADPAAAIFTSPKASFAIKGTDGVIKTFQLGNNSLNGLRDAINASGAAVQATVINTGSGAKPYQLVITAKDTGTGTTGGVITLASIDNEDLSASTVDPSLGIVAGSLGLDPGDPTGTGTFSAPKTLTGGNQSAAAKDAIFTLNGVQLTRKSNVVSDAADGVTFTLKQGGQTTATVLTVGADKAGATTGIQDLITKFNAMVKSYTDNSKSTQDENGTILPGPLTGNATARTLISQLRSALTGVAEGVPASSSVKSLASVGVRTLSDGTLTLDTSTFQTAYEKDPTAVMRLFTFTGTSSNGSVSVKGGGANSPSGAVTFTIDSYAADGAVSGRFSGVDAKGNAFTDLVLTGSNGTMVGAAGTALEGLSLSVTGTGSGTLNITRGSGQKVRDLVSKFTASGTGDLTNLLSNIDKQNKSLSDQIFNGQSALDRRKVVLKNQFAKMETLIAQMKSSGGNLNNLG